MRPKVIFVSFLPEGNRFQACIPLRDFSSFDDPESVLLDASDAYSTSILEMRNQLLQVQQYRAEKVPVPARLVWQMGEAIFVLVDTLRQLGLQIDGLYQHLCRDLGVSRKWLEKVVILRRYIPSEHLLPESLSWGQLEKGTRWKCLRLVEGLPLQ